MDPAYTPAERINGSMLTTRAGKEVNLVGTVLGCSAGSVQFKTSDDQQILLHTTSDAVFETGQIMEVQGNVAADQSMNVESYTIFNETFDLRSYDRMIKHAHGRVSGVFKGV